MTGSYSINVMNKIYDPRIMGSEMTLDEKLYLVTKESFLTNIKLFLNKLFGMCNVYASFAKEVTNNQKDATEIIKLLEKVFKKIKTGNDEQSIKKVIKYFRQLHDIKIIKDNGITFTLSKSENGRFLITLIAPGRKSIKYEFQGKDVNILVDTIDHNFNDNVLKFYNNQVKYIIEFFKEEYTNLAQNSLQNKYINQFKGDIERLIPKICGLEENDKPSNAKSEYFVDKFIEFLREIHKNISKEQIMKIKTLYHQAGFPLLLLGHIKHTSYEVLGQRGLGDLIDQKVNFVAHEKDTLVYKYECTIVISQADDCNAFCRMEIPVSSEFSINKNGNMVNGELKMGKVKDMHVDMDNYNLIKDIIALKIEATNKAFSKFQANPINNVNYA